MLTLCEAVQAPLKPEKVIGPSTVLGIELDTVRLQARLPEEKLAALMKELLKFSLLPDSSRTCSKRQLLSLIGKLAFACKVIPAGHIFLRRLIDTTHTVDNPSHLILRQCWTPANEFQLYADASGTLGYGAYWNGAWCSQAWPPQFPTKSIESKELYGLVRPGASTGKGRDCSFTVTMKPLSLFGNQAAHEVQTL